MRIVVTANTVPYMSGGAEYHIQGLIMQLKLQGHEVEAIRFPFWFSPNQDILHLMEHCRHLDFNQPNGIRVDKLISLQFPAYGVQHNDHRVWVMHQHRSVYELFKEQQASIEEQKFRQKVIEFDNHVLGKIPKRFANSKRVAERLKTYNQLDSTPLYHPPYGFERFYTEQDQAYIFYPSRLETLKRQDLLIEAARHLTTPVKILLAGDGGQKQTFMALVNQYQLHDKVRFLGRVSENEKLAFYANSLAVFFGPFDEDYGYITLEAMLSSKPVITCEDSGGPLEFVQHNESGFVLEPEPKKIAAAIDELYHNRQRAKEMGQYGLEIYQQKQISWENVVEKLLE